MNIIKKIISLLVLYILRILLIIILIGIGFGLYFSEKGYSGLVTAHFDGKKFFNIKGKSGNGMKEVFELIRTR